MSCSVHVQFPAGKPITVSVNGISIARDAIQREMQHHPAAKPIAAWQHAARALVIRELLLQRAKHLDLAPEPICDEAGRRETEDEALMRAVVDREVTVPEPDDETCRRYYERNRARFHSSDIYEVSHILFAAVPENHEDYAQARADAAAVLATLQESPECFAALAKAYSRCPSAEQGGNLGQITEGQTTPEFERALVSLSAGELCTEPVATRYGFHIIRLERKHGGRVLPYEAVSERIADYLRESVRRRA
ncbi:MAG: peptidylprolyl isomerase, partial [Pseudolabrys sp.]